MGIDVFMRWGRAARPFDGAYEKAFRGRNGYLRASYHSGPYATAVLVPEAFGDPSRLATWLGTDAPPGAAVGATTRASRWSRRPSSAHDWPVGGSFAHPVLSGDFQCRLVGPFAWRRTLVVPSQPQPTDSGAESLLDENSRRCMIRQFNCCSSSGCVATVGGCSGRRFASEHMGASRIGRPGSFVGRLRDSEATAECACPRPRLAATGRVGNYVRDR